jgi:uncharacterized Zn-binding protein involved in type VI secretion
MLPAMGQPAARIGDMHTCPMVTGIVPHVGGPIAMGSPNVLVGGMPQARITDTCICVGPPDLVMRGAVTVLVNNMPAARMGDMSAHGGVIVVGCPTVLIGDAGGGSGGGGGAASGLMTTSITLGEIQAQTLVNAAEDGAPFCARCAAAAAAAAASK